MHRISHSHYYLRGCSLRLARGGEKKEKVYFVDRVLHKVVCLKQMKIFRKVFKTLIYTRASQANDFVSILCPGQFCLIPPRHFRVLFARV